METTLWKKELQEIARFRRASSDIILNLLPLSRLEARELSLLIGYVMETMPRSKPERYRYYHQLRAFSRLVMDGILPVRLEEYTADRLILATREDYHRMDAAWRFLVGWLEYVLKQGFALDRSLRLLSLPPHLWRSHTSDEALERVRPLLAQLANAPVSTYRALRYKTHLATRIITCRQSEELLAWPLRELPRHRLSAYPLTDFERSLLETWRDIVIRYRELRGSPITSETPFFAPVRGDKPLSIFSSWAEAIEQELTMPLNVDLQTVGNMSLVYAVYPHEIEPFLLNLYQSLTDYYKELLTRGLSAAESSEED